MLYDIEYILSNLEVSWLWCFKHLSFLKYWEVSDSMEKSMYGFLFCIHLYFLMLEIQIITFYIY